LAHERVDPREACAAVFPALEVRLCFGAVDEILAGDELGFGIDGGWEVPGNEAALRIVICVILAARSLRESRLTR